MDILVSTNGIIRWSKGEARCVIGRNRVTANKHEGDGATPLGRFPLRRVLYRADRLTKPLTGLPVSPILHSDGWCDDPLDPYYNHPVTLPYPARHEVLWRQDAVYDVIVILGYNDISVVPGKGSAIFMHVARPNYTPTEGCIALALFDLLRILENCNPDDYLVVASAK